MLGSTQSLVRFLLSYCLRVVSDLVFLPSGHAFLWKHGVEHSDPSLWNVMYHPIRKCGVLTDFDLTVFAWLTRVPGSVAKVQF